MDLLCIDSEKEFIQLLEKGGHTVYDGELGYKSGKCQIDTPPHEVDAMIYNLEKPACFDSLKWGAENSNYKCIIESSPTDEMLISQEHDRAHEEPRYQLIFDRQINKIGSRFKAADIVKAITVGGLPLFVFLNDAYLRHVGHRYGNVPNFFDDHIQYEKTKATKSDINDDFADIFPALLSNQNEIKIPIKYKIERDGGQRSIDILYNNVGDVFSRIIWYKKSFVWLLPEFKKNDFAVLRILEKLDHLKGFVLNLVIMRQSSPSPKPKSVIIDINESRLQNNSEVLSEKKNIVWDLFVCHASEDKEDFVRPLSMALKSKELEVWYDEFTLKVGDSLRKKIENGLINSKFGIVVLSPNFFAKKWPQDELDGLFALEQNGKKRILPIWHNINEPEVRKFSPILAGRYAAKSSEGLDIVVKKILEAIV